MTEKELIFPLLKQLEILRTNKRYANITEAATVSNGIKILEDDEAQKLVDVYDRFTGSVSKFIPASGAASRMFKHVRRLAKSPSGTLEQEFISEIENFPFYDLLEDKAQEILGKSISELITEKLYEQISELVLSKNGLGYGAFPKGLIPFHLYKNGELRTPFAEQIIEGIALAKNKNEVNLHFTIPPEHESDIKLRVALFSQKHRDVELNITYSVQHPETNTVAVDKAGEQVMLGEQKVLLRPGGHGALIYNLNTVESDVVFVKNIDNIVLESDLEQQVYWKKLLAGYLLTVQQKVFAWQKSIKENSYDSGALKSFLEIEFSYQFSGDTDSKVMEKLIFRPLRVCGMVKNEGDPGGGPYFVEENGFSALQIVESAEIDKQNATHLKLLRGSSHFNPVDLVCSAKNHLGEKLDLEEFLNPDACFTSYKDYEGKEIKILELPGLWNGAMAKWNTVFIEVPKHTFNPVKTVNDLLRKKSI